VPTDQIRVYTTAHLEAVCALLEEPPKAFRDLLGTAVSISAFQLDPDGPEYRSIFSGSAARARASTQGDVYIDARRVRGEHSLRAVLFHEVAHAMQYVLHRPLRFATWTQLYDIDFWDNRARRLLQLVADKCGLKDVIIPPDPVQLRPSAKHLLNSFADADVHAFLLKEDVLDLVSYGEALTDYLATVRASTQRAGSRTLPALWAEYQRFDQRPHRLAAQAWPVFADWMIVVGGRWGRVGPLVGRPDAAAVLDTYVGPDRHAMREQLGEFFDDRVFDIRWRELVDAGDDVPKLLKVFERLASDAVGMVRSICDR
jgi:hypothetical protein